MRTIRRSTQFKKDIKRESRGAYRTVVDSELLPIISMLAKDEELPVKLRDHALTGVWKGYRDCHVRPDLLLIYCKPDGVELELVRLASHSELGF